MTSTIRDLVELGVFANFLRPRSFILYTRDFHHFIFTTLHEVDLDVFTTFRLLLAVTSIVDNTSAKRPDVIVIIADQWSSRYVSCDNPEVRTPHLDQIAKEGVIFDACYTPSPVCIPARISLISGLYPHNGGHALWGNGQNYCPPVQEAAMFRDIRSAGLTTAQIGKTHSTSRRKWEEKYSTLEDFYSALGLDQFADIRRAWHVNSRENARLTFPTRYYPPRAQPSSNSRERLAL